MGGGAIAAAAGCIIEFNAGAGAGGGCINASAIPPWDGAIGAGGAGGGAFLACILADTSFTASSRGSTAPGGGAGPDGAAKP